MRRGWLTHWIAATARLHGRAATSPVGAVPRPTGPPFDHDRIARVGDALHACFPDDEEEILDDKLTALMLRLTVEPPEPPAPRRR